MKAEASIGWVDRDVKTESAGRSFLSFYRPGFTTH